MKVLVTGINGFVGFYLRQELETRGHTVIGLDVKSDNGKVLAVDITDRVQTLAAVEKAAPDAIIHLAGIARVNFDNPGILYNVNTFGTMNLLSACIGKDIRFLFVSSSQVYGNVEESKLPITEELPVNPVNHYGASKAAAECIVKAFTLENNIDAVIARPFNHTGKGQTPNFVVPKIVNAFRNKELSIELGNTETIRDFLDVRDVVKAYVSIIESFHSGEIYNIASGRSMKISEVFKMLAAITGHPMQIVNKEFLKRKSEINSVLGSSSKLEHQTGWKPEYSMEDTLISMLG